MRSPTAQRNNTFDQGHSMSDSYNLEGGEKNGGVPITSTFQVKDSSTKAASSDSSVNTLHENVHSSDACSDSADTLSLVSVASPKDLDFRRLTLDDGSARPFHNGAQRYSSPYHRGLVSSPDSGAYTSYPRERVWRDNNARSGSQFNNRAGGGGYRNSRTWVSPDVQAQEDFLIIRNSMRRQFKHSDVAKWKLADYVAHREAMVASQAGRLARKLEQREPAPTKSYAVIPESTQDSLKKWGIDGNFNEDGNTGRVLGEPTIWCRDWQNGKDEIAPWPSMAEMKWEGDDRAKTGVGRFLPLPREQGPPSLAWNSLPVVEQYPMDQIAKIPTMEDVYLPVDDQIEEDKEYLWSKELEQEMDAFLES
ncbi:hypothetical protein NX059_008618 [Plenodomus lindquistii]|nr:hypothetical protein NX059_008618 [Plenodomus lindquistii]